MPRSKPKEKSFLENDDKPAMMETQPVENTAPSSAEDAKDKIIKELNAKVESANKTIASFTQGLPPAHSPKDVPIAANNWQPASKLTVTGKKPGFKYFWIRNNAEDINKAILEGHIIDQDPTCCADMVSKKDPTGTWSNVKIRGDLILTRMPLDVLAARTQYIKDKQISSTTVAKELAATHNDGGRKGQMTGEIEREMVKESF